MRAITNIELRSIQIGLLDALDAFCQANNLRYSLGGGTLLGAVRHKGFIPWDDDVDVMMPRPDYDLFLESFSHPFIKVQHPRNSKDAYITFAKVFDSRTLLYEHYATNGVFVDLFPIDGLPPSNLISEYCRKQQKYLDNLYFIHDYKTKAYLDYDKSLPIPLVKFKYWIKNLFSIDRDECIRQIEALHYTYDFSQSEFAGAICGAYGEKEHMRKEIFTSYIQLPFESKEYMCIEHYHEYLTKHYGDYMKLPPLEKQVASHNLKIYWKD